MNITTPAYHIRADREFGKPFHWTNGFSIYLGPASLIFRHALPYLIAGLLASSLDSNHYHFHGLISVPVMLWLRPLPQPFPFFSFMSSLTSQEVFAGIHRVFTAIKDFCRPGPKPTDSDSMDGSLKPMLWSSRITQTRIYPPTHSLSYSHLLAGFPISSTSLSYGPLLSSHEPSYPLPPAWFSVHAQDHLQHGSSFANHSLRARLDAYLTSQNIDPSIYPVAYLVTAPRFLGLTFNTVSFWYLYTTTRQLGSMVLEVKDSVEGRRLYLLRPHKSKKTTKPDSGSRGSVFHFEWQKDSRALPFHDQQDVYSISTVDVASTGLVDVTIQLWDSSGHEGEAKVVSRVRSIPPALTQPSLATAIHGLSAHTDARLNSCIGRGVDLLLLTNLQRFKVLLEYGGISCLANLWMLRQAWTHWRKNINRFYSSGPFSSQPSRIETPQETAIEKSFRHLLDTLADRAGITISYISAAGVDRHTTVLSGAVKHVHTKSTEGTVDPVPRKLLHIHALTPMFYTEVARANGKLVDVFERFCFHARDSETLISISDEGLMKELLAFMPEVEMKNIMVGTSLSTKTYRLSVIWTRAICQVGWLRALQVVLLSVAQAQQQGQETDVPLVWSELDSWMIGRSDEAEYFRAVRTIMLADRIAMGSTVLLRLQWRAMRALAVAVLTPVFCLVLDSCF